ncbi:4-hydroxy-tetrahydrodipicolinate synthase [Marinicella rhabdoformis]|uniref:4-hydroxy-tetrahydrodipicolinate synthase n=1 Tax=Marinicella rhabdoformis TaxID=2580566 RepID=UPI0012AEC584|nr:4-hydroxy-tetrahydrodipicolinate synthase [Marinicella rhabdoformis]
MKAINSQDLTGSMVALVTPMDADGRIDFEQWENLINWHIKAGTDALVVAGTTGESAMLTEKEFEELVRTCKQICEGHEILIIAGTGAITPEAVLKKNNLAYNLGADAALVVTPYYIRITQNALIEHYQNIADHSDLPIILYNVPGRTGMDIDTQTSKTLAKHPNIIGIKEAKPDMQRIETLSKLNNFSVLSGDDDTFFEAMKFGADGVISVAANIRPRAIKAVCTAVQLGDLNLANELNQTLLDTFKLMSTEPNPGPVKSSLMAANIINPGIRKPLTTMNLSGQSHKNLIAKIIEEYES